MTEKNSLRGKKSRAAGARFELRVRQKLEEMGWTVSKWMNVVDYDTKGKMGIIPAKRKYNPFKKALVIGTGFPDFMAFKKIDNFIDADGMEHDGGYEIIGIEVKIRGYLDKAEKDMCRWMLENKVFGKILIAKKGKKRGEILYDDFEKKYSRSK